MISFSPLFPVGNCRSVCVHVHVRGWVGRPQECNLMSPWVDTHRSVLCPLSYIGGHISQFTQQLQLYTIGPFPVFHSPNAEVYICLGLVPTGGIFFFFWFMQLYWRKINQLLAELLVDHSSIDNLHHLFSAILNSVLEDRLTNSSKPPNNLNENYKMFWDPILEYKGCLTSNFHSL